MTEKERLNKAVNYQCQLMTIRSMGINTESAAFHKLIKAIRKQYKCGVVYAVNVAMENISSEYVKRNGYEKYLEKVRKM